MNTTNDRSIRFGFILIVSMVLLSVSCQDEHVDTSVETNTPQPQQEWSEKVTITGKQLYLNNCAGCHMPDLRGDHPEIPSLEYSDRKPDRGWLLDKMKDGPGKMPSYTDLSEKERQLIADYLLGKKPGSVTRNRLDQVSYGKQIFRGNCARCHRPTTKDDPPPLIPVDQLEHPKMTEPAPMAGVTSRYPPDSRKTFEKILDRGPDVMWPYTYLLERERDALWAYFQTLEGKGEPEGRTQIQRVPSDLKPEHPGTEPGAVITPSTITTAHIARAIRSHVKVKQASEQGEQLLQEPLIVRDRKKDRPVKFDRLVKIHRNRLSQVDERTYFACVNMRSMKDTMYDIDFFLELRGGSLHVTDTFIHKVEGEPRYEWIYEDGEWKRKP